MTSRFWTICAIPLLPMGAAAAVLVMTSANIGGEPILYSDNDLERLGDLADGVLTHNRPILMPCDDSVMRIVGSGRQLLRRSRGYAPLPVTAPFDVPPTLAVGADLKNTFCLAQGHDAYLGPHIGDLDNLETLQAFERAVARLQRFVATLPQVIAQHQRPAVAFDPRTHRQQRGLGLQLQRTVNSQRGGRHHSQGIGFIGQHQRLDHQGL